MKVKEILQDELKNHHEANRALGCQKYGLRSGIAGGLVDDEMA